MGAADAYVVIAAFFGLAGGVVGKIKGGSFWLWFLISMMVPIFGLLAAIAFRNERNEYRRRCPRCGRIVKLHETLCTRCGSELYFPEHLIVPEAQVAHSASANRRSK
ncbi:MAG TPA: hypothetical protein VKU89_06850 [Solirubrobacteraceae bacterium]|nr:hypothetical protein [Solirubrobacteraceae bacterium]